MSQNKSLFGKLKGLINRTPKHPTFVSNARTIAPYIRETLDKLGMPHTEVQPEFTYITVEGIRVKVQTNEDFESYHQLLYGDSAMGVLGYAIRLPAGDLALIREGPLNIVLTTTGHELGHFFAPILESDNEEEAKALAFEYAWCKAIQDHNIADLGDKAMKLFEDYINKYQPCSFVASLIQDGYEPLQLYWDIANDKLRTYSGIYGENYIPLK